MHMTPRSTFKTKLYIERSDSFFFWLDVHFIGKCSAEKIYAYVVSFKKWNNGKCSPTGVCKT